MNTIEFNTIIQRISVLFEVFGFILVVIEIYFAETADSIEHFLDNLAKGEYLQESRVAKALSFENSYFLFRMAVAYLQKDRIFEDRKILYMLNKLGEERSFIVFLSFPVVVILGLAFWTSAFFLNSCVKSLNIVAKGRALGAFGLLFSLTGVVIELYQLFRS